MNLLTRPAVQPPRRQPTASSTSTPAPVGGWNARDALDGMKPEDAIILDNWFPQTDRISLRQGHESYATGLGSGSVESLVPYASGTTTKFLACANDSIYDISSSGSGTSLASSLTSSRPLSRTGLPRKS